MKKLNSQQAQEMIGKGVFSLKSYALDAPKQGLERTNQRYNQEDFIPWFDSDNFFPLHINERSHLSTTHHRILQDKVSYMLGNGLIISGNETSSLETYLECCNAQSENIEQVLLRLAMDYCSFGNAFLYIIKNKDFTALSHLDASWCRIARKRSGILYSRGFNRRNEYRTMPELKPAFIPHYPDFAAIEGSKSRHAVIHIKEYAPGYFWYGQIDYYAAYYSGWLDIDYHIPKYNLSRFHNQFRPSGMLVVSGRGITEAQAEQIQKDVAKNYIGEGTASKLLIAIVDDHTQEPKYIPFDDVPSGAFNDLQRMANENIILAHGWHPSLLLQQPGKLSTSKDIVTAFEQVYHTVINRKQRALLRPLSRILKDLGFGFDSITVSTPAPVSYAGGIEPQNVLTINEQRSELGYAPIENENIIKQKLSNS